MGRIVVTTNMSLDGVVQDPDGGEGSWVCPQTGEKYTEKDDTLVEAGQS